MPDSKLNIDFLEKLCNAFGPSGFEREAQKVAFDYGKEFAEDIEYDRMGSVVFKHGSKGPKIMLAGHIDEIGFVITEITKKGFLKFHQLGGWWDQTLLTQEVLIHPSQGDDEIIGIIGAPPPHILSPEARSKVVTKDKMYIDIGASSEKEVKDLGIRVGDPAVPYAFFRTMERIREEKKEDSDEKETRKVTLAAAKAFDDRIGVFIGLEVLRRLSEDKIEHPNTLYMVSTTQEEVGLRGARTSAQMIQPDIGFSLDVDISGDVPGAEGIVQKMGKGVSISAGDGSMIPNPKFRQFVTEVAEEIGVRHQPAFLKSGGTDAGIIHITGMGAPSLFLGIPTRHIHSHHALLDLSDVENAITLLVEVIKRLDKKTVDSFTKL
ncbi:MAG: M20/M25/M40 family metallo-hydrolase [Candidatus Lokiarchaeota archaeon]|nr:M20/M25/M40 family metallo-hydrolase [Candidatus Lokiarchaeota archaeon]